MLWRFNYLFILVRDFINQVIRSQGKSDKTRGKGFNLKRITLGIRKKFFTEWVVKC